MKTTIDIADPLLHAARKLAAKEGVTVKEGRRLGAPAQPGLRGPGRVIAVDTNVLV